jgi:hypothetical protein
MEREILGMTRTLAREHIETDNGFVEIIDEDFIRGTQYMAYERPCECDLCLPTTD